jgi:hypothetical protein
MVSSLLTCACRTLPAPGRLDEEMAAYLVNMIGVDMMPSMRRPPCEIWAQQDAVRKEPHRVGNKLVLREGPMSSLMSEDPETSSGKGNEERVDHQIEQPLIRQR